MHSFFPCLWYDIFRELLQQILVHRLISFSIMIIISYSKNQTKANSSHSLLNHSVLRASMSESHPHRLWIASLLSTVFKGTKYLGKIPKVTEYHTSKSDWGLCICWDVVLRNHWAVLGERGLFFLFLYKPRKTLAPHLFLKSLIIILFCPSKQI